MKIRKLLAGALAVCLAAWPAACKKETKAAANAFDFDFAAYVDELPATDGLVTATEVTAFAGKTVMPTGTDYLQAETYDLVTFRTNEGQYGYLLGRDKVIGPYAELTVQHAGGTYIQGVTEQGRTDIVGLDGNVIFSDMGAAGEIVVTGPVAKSRGGIPGMYRKFAVESDGTEWAKYAQLVTDYYDPLYACLLGSYEESAFDPAFEVTTGKPILPERKSIADLFGLEESRVKEGFTYASVESEYGTGYVFYRGDEELSQLILSADEISSPLMYAGGRILYATVDPVDFAKADGYNVLTGNAKGRFRLYAFDIAGGRTAELTTDYVIQDVVTSLYNRQSESYDAIMVKALPMKDGVAVDNGYADTYIVNAMGAVGYRASAYMYGTPEHTVGAYFITEDDAGNSYLTDKSGKLVSGPFKFHSALKDRLVVSVDGKIGSIDYTGKIVAPFEHETTEVSIYGRHAVLTTESGKAVLDLTTGRTRAVEDIVSSTNYTIENGRISVDNGTKSWYDLSGRLLAKNIRREYDEVAGNLGSQYYRLALLDIGGAFSFWRLAY